MVKRPTNQQIATFFDVVVILAEHEGKIYSETGQTIFPGLPRPIPEVKIVLDWLYQLKNGYDDFNPNPTPLPIPTPVPEAKKKGVKKGTIPWNKGVKKVQEIVKNSSPPETFQTVPTPDELPTTIVKPGKAFEYAEEVAGNVLIIPDDPTVISNPK